MKIVVSGLYCGASPQPGVGVVRSVRQGFPDATIVGVEYSNRVSGIHWDEIDDLWIQRPWGELDLNLYGEFVRKTIEGGALWISGSDLEALWLATLFPEGHPNLLAPPMDALRRIAKPEVDAANALPIEIPPFVSTAQSDWELHKFCRDHDWRVWLKGPYYDASRTPSWESFEYVRRALQKVWSTQRLFLQAHASGYEESVMLSAYRGELLGAVSMRKRDITPEGKTWAGDVSEVPEEFLGPLREMVKALNWTGGGELEMVRDAAERLWLLEMNPRFPAWVHGATIGGFNLPALMVERATGVKASPVASRSREFTRVVIEIPVLDEYPLPPLIEPYVGAVGHSMKHPSGLTSLAEKLHEEGCHRPWVPVDEEAAIGSQEIPSLMIEDIQRHDFSALQTPQFLFMEATAATSFKAAAERAREFSTAEVEMINAYSIKTNPDDRLIELALQSGFLAEAISLLEVQKAIDIGFEPGQIILNGPGKWWPEGMMPNGRLHAMFCDSIADLDRCVAGIAAGKLSCRHLGVRIRTPNVVSRFGIPVHSPAAFRAMIDSVKRLPEEVGFGVHFHMASANVGIAQWWHLLESMLKWCRSIERLGGRVAEILDVGGGWFPDDWQNQDSNRVHEAMAMIRAMLPEVRQLISEPGKAMAQPSMSLAMRILEIQEHEDEKIEAVVDASIAELPMYSFYPHRMLRKCGRTGELTPLGRGETQLMGRLCMEHDVVASNVALPAGTEVGDVLIFCDSGGYDRSMSYVFGRG